MGATRLAGSAFGLSRCLLLNFSFLKDAFRSFRNEPLRIARLSIGGLFPSARAIHHSAAMSMRLFVCPALVRLDVDSGVSDWLCGPAFIAACSLASIVVGHG